MARGALLQCPLAKPSAIHTTVTVVWVLINQDPIFPSSGRARTPILRYGPRGA